MIVVNIDSHDDGCGQNHMGMASGAVYCPPIVLKSPVQLLQSSP